MEAEQKGKKWLKWVGYTIGGIALFLFAFTWLGLHVDDFLKWKSEREARAFDAALEAQKKQLAAMEAADTYGSTTPEGTIDLIIAALEKNDIDLASKYYYVLDQEKAKASFQVQVAEKGSLAISIQFFKDIRNGKKSCNTKGDGCSLEFEYATTEDEYVDLMNNPQKQLIPKGSKQVKSNDFRLNHHTQNWKAIE